MQGSTVAASPDRRLGSALVADIAVALAFSATILLAAAMLGPDASWDLRNYHLYNGFAFLSGRSALDLAPAQMQTYHAPFLDAGYVLLLRLCGAIPCLVAAGLAVPHAVAVALVWFLTRKLLPPWPAFLATAIGATGIAGLPTLGSTMSQMAPAACLLGAILLLLRKEDAELSTGICFSIGLLGGAAVGLQLTSAPSALGLAAMLLVQPKRTDTARLLGVFLGGAVIGAGLVAGFWWWSLWQRFGNPVFPYFNDIFGSPWIAPASMRDLRFMPRSIWQALAYPLFWAAMPQTFVIELPSCDPRIALGWIAVLVIIIRSAAPHFRSALHINSSRARLIPSWPGLARPSTTLPIAANEDTDGPCQRAITVQVERHSRPYQPLLLSAFWIISFLAWEACFSIVRYLVVLELLSGIMLMLALASVRELASRQWYHFLNAVLVLSVASLTVYPDWGRVNSAARTAVVELPATPPDSLMILLDPSPMAYIAAFAPPRLRFIGANNNLVHPGDNARLAQAVNAAIREATIPLWGVEMPEESPGIADATLRAYGLERANGCSRIASNLDNNGILACPLRRATVTTARRSH
jgi:hypothetical protein